MGNVLSQGACVIFINCSCARNPHARSQTLGVMELRPEAFGRWLDLDEVMKLEPHDGTSGPTESAPWRHGGKAFGGEPNQLSLVSSLKTYEKQIPPVQPLSP